MNTFVKTSLTITVGVVLGAAGYHVLSPTLTLQHQSAADEPLYWVAPMDPNYRRDQPGKSPMGMDLIPVYADSEGANSPGTVTISPEVENNLGVRVINVSHQPFHSEINTVGYVGFNEDALVHVHPRVEGWLETLFVKVEGERVTQGDPLFSIYSPELVNAQEELLLALDRKSTKLIKSAKERLRALQVPESQIQAVVENRAVSRTVTIVAPQSGVIANLDVYEGFFVKPGKTILSVGPLDEIWVTAELFERQANLVNVGDKVSMTLDYAPGREWQGRVDYIYPMLDQDNRTARVRLRFANKNETLKPNMFAQVAIHADSDKDTLIVPREALIRTGSQDRVVLAMGEGKYKSVAVQVGRIDSEQAELIAGVQQGDSIVSSSQFLLDSESSISSDFLRMSSADTALAKTVWAEGVVKSVNPLDREVTVEHEPVDAWQWPAMTMKFGVAEVVDIELLTPETHLHFEIAEANNAYSIQGIHIISSGPDRSSTSAGEHSGHKEMDHSQHQTMEHNGHKEMDHSQHQTMNHSDHEGMDHRQHQTMNHSDHEGLAHSQHQSMNHSDHEGMDRSQHQTMEHSGHEGMDHSQHSGSASNSNKAKSGEQQ
ncbi:efflux RND transporter periplasmic adaptor subunit [Neiella sp. HB171785]|uniref:Efflux RND transporter periplasmic adaptor subunit n=1 Tax=Neiella litorisoli TaxID=2771431 RepID=A0A8J6QQ03_9GAMM|nr:efflux RND transporter periplasmic adaptor subunit [Neiella litorisoli]MBD1388399.1 efflux RND transporter periplasmic adaptor subunit [Neiella litorisoli]